MNRVAYFLEGLWLPLHANLDGFWHLIRGHKVRWFEDPHLGMAHLGWIICHDCSDSPDRSSVAIWGFHFHRVHRLIRFVCSLFGHANLAESRVSVEVDGVESFVPSGDLYCTRCFEFFKGGEK